MPKQKYAKIAISLPQELLDEIERRCTARGESRSEVVREAVTRLLREDQRRRDIDAYIRGYQLHPETAEEVAEQVALLEATAPYIAHEYPWDDD